MGFSQFFFLGKWDYVIRMAQYKNLMTAMHISDTSRQRALLLDYVGEDVRTKCVAI